MRFITLISILLLFTLPLHAQDENPLSAGDRLFNIDINLAPGEDYTDIFMQMCELGLNSVKLSFDWTDIEYAPGQYENENPGIANIFYPAFNTRVDLMIRPVHTGTLRVPDDIANLPLDDPQVIERFNAMLDWTLSQMSDTTIGSLSIGSELDSYLGTNARLWEQYENFAIAVRVFLADNYPEIPVAFEMIYSSLLNDNTAEFAQSLNQHADIIGVSYYPLQGNFTPYPDSHVSETFAALVETYPEKPIYFYQLGYPSGAIVDSSEEQQAQFVETVFEEWDNHADHIEMISFTWLTDLSDESVAYFEDYYSFSSRRFRGFLGSIGLREQDGTPKQAYDVLIEEATARGWQNRCL